MSIKNYAEMTKEELILSCEDKDRAIKECMIQSRKNQCTLLGKKDIMKTYNCGSEKALNIMRLAFKMGYGIKMGKEYYIQVEKHNDFVKDFAGKEVCI